MGGVIAAVVVALLAATASHGAAKPPWYVSLGDSLSQGVEPGASGANVYTNEGYADQLYAIERRKVPGLRLAKLGCSGETTTTMLNGGICRRIYNGGNQLGTAVAFLKSHRVALVTIDIGSNDVDRCLHGGAIDVACVTNGTATVTRNLAKILAAIRKVAPRVPVYAMNYYDPFLGLWVQGGNGQAVSGESVLFTVSFNSTLASLYARYRVGVADVAAAFKTTDTTTPPSGDKPANVAAICTYTWMCAAPPVGPNVHANKAGYALIAATFARRIGALH